ncbi:MAG: beta-ketoacyl synthase chain length factor [Burkholderiaceae bacterium]|nr:beta-ketoacyl synthase chain length factor [Burkholderiaceae bacterium]
MKLPSVFVEAVGICGPGLGGWAAAKPCLQDERMWKLQATVIPTPELLTPSERRRIGLPVKLAIAAGCDALTQTHLSVQSISTVFTSSCADGDNCHPICETLAMTERLISPTRFTNSVHNAPSGYWGIALQARASSTSICAFDASFSAGLLEAASQCLFNQTPVLLIAYETPYPQPLHDKRPLLESMSVALLLAAQVSSSSQAKLDISMINKPATSMDTLELDKVRLGIPAARSLPLLKLLANKKRGVAVLEYLNPFSLNVELNPIE